MGQPRKSSAALARDAALARIVRTRRWVIVATAGLTAGIAALVSAVAPGHSLASKSKSSAATASAAGATTAGGGSSVPRMPAPADPGSLGLQGPAQAPSPAPDQSQTQTQPQSQPQDQSQPQSIPSQPPPQSSSGGGGPVVSGGS
jgi:hypothetical protein